VVGFDQLAGPVPVPAPERLAMAADECQRLISLLDDELLRKIVQLKCDGFTNDEIAQALGFTCRSIERKLQRRETLARQSDRYNDSLAY
jgi:DNA-directed RNA polymerase specialized sigma24 family protein